jgi:hypothetical protein
LHRRAAIWETPLVELFCHLYSENPSLLLSLPSTSTTTDDTVQREVQRQLQVQVQ